MKTRKTGRCPQCCPDGGAIFSYGFNDDLKPVWKCNNCSYRSNPIVARKAPAIPNARQERAIAFLLQTFGGEVEKKEMIGRKVWITLINRSRHFLLGQHVYGTIGSCGALDLTLQRCGSDIKVKDRISASVYLKS